jgi:hypothetical protein
MTIRQSFSSTANPSTVETPNTLYECGFCSQQFNALTAVNAHIDQQHSTNDNKDISCLICSTAFLNLNDLKIHMSVVHPMKCESNSIELTKKQNNQQTLKELFDRLENFDWCACNRCVLFCKLFIDHLKETHTTKLSVKRSATSTVTSVQTTPKPQDRKLHDHTYFADDYFENANINLTFPEPSPDKTLARVEPKLINYPSMANTKKKVFFKIRKVGDTKIFICTVCRSTIKDHVQLLGHFKMHLMKRELSKTDVERKKKLTTPIVQGNLNILATILGAEMKPVKSVMEYQCSVCAEVSSTRALALRCLRRHVDNSWPVGLDIGVVWENLTKDNEVRLEMLKKKIFIFEFIRFGCSFFAFDIFFDPFLIVFE